MSSTSVNVAGMRGDLATFGLPQVQIHDPYLRRDIFGVNELEWVRGELWGNVYPMYQGTASECIVRINATNGEVRDHLSDFTQDHQRRSPRCHRSRRQCPPRRYFESVALCLFELAIGIQVRA